MLSTSSPGTSQIAGCKFFVKFLEFEVEQLLELTRMSAIDLDQRVWFARLFSLHSKQSHAQPIFRKNQEGDGYETTF